MNPNSSLVPTIQLSMVDLSVSGVLILAAGLISILLHLKMEKKLFLASARTVIQLLLLGYILRYVFRIDNPFVLGIVLVFMTSAAAYTAVANINRTVKGIFWLALVTLALTGFSTTFVVTQLVINVEPWYQPRYVIPLAGMVFGNALTGISLSLDQFLEELSIGRERVEMELSLGATRWEAASFPIRSSLKRGMIPIINTMMAAGLVSLPGMMTGQILAGADPLEAVKYQIVVMFMITAATVLGCMLSVLLVYRRLFNDRHQLRIERIWNR
ncbi:MAG: iron export ABC transporter permease subunit FetB [Calditrichaeota bacterium]|jgi:putative ABC transport system permease protein|nr:iron export ABC transporter permease subunit FetB [Calditrichota bacterium]